MQITTLHRGDSNFPSRLQQLGDKCPLTIDVRGQLLFGPTVAIVGTRECSEEGRYFAGLFANMCVRAGAIVVSGGARGIDEAVHRGAWLAGGPTWMVLPNGRDKPQGNRIAFQKEARGAPGVTFIWPFDHDTPCDRGPTFFARNRVLAALSDVVVLVEGGLASGTRNTARHARALGRKLWAVPAPPWTLTAAGCLWEIEHGAIPLLDPMRFLQRSGLKPERYQAQLELPAMDLLMRQVFDNVGRAPTHVDFIVEKSHLPTSTVAATLLTLALEHVLVEGPPGHYRRA